MTNIEQLKSKFISFKTECQLTLNSLEIKEKEYNSIKEYNENLQKARVLIAEAGKYTQSYLKDYIESMVTTALQAVFEEDYQFVIDFDIKRNKPEAKISLKLRGEETDPKDSCGGGVLDVASFALRVILWSIENPKSSNVIILDEPMKFLHGRIENAMKMIKDLSKKLNIQFIIVSQLSEMAEQADKIFEISHNGKFSIIKEINNGIN